MMTTYNVWGVLADVFSYLQFFRPEVPSGVEHTYHPQ